MIEIEQAIIDRLKVKLDYLKAVGPVGDLLMKELPDDLLILCPAVYVTFTAAQFTPRGTNYLYWQDCTFSLSIVGRNYVSVKTLLHGDAFKRGVYHILNDIYTNMLGTWIQELDDSYMPLLPGPLKQEHVDRNVAVYSWDWNMKRSI